MDGAAIHHRALSRGFEYATVDKSKKALEFKYWLANVGSPHSRIDGCKFSDEVSSSVQSHV
eukprot:CCRYP_015549-RB/>CCRYP_015549-RB protein AED:0.30 eAED:0.30 QI:276/0/1/1/0/0/2/179/60